MAPGGHGPSAGCHLSPGAPGTGQGPVVQTPVGPVCAVLQAGPGQTRVHLPVWRLGRMLPGAAHAWSLPYSAPAPGAGGDAGSCRARAPARCWGAPTSPRSMRDSTQCTGTAATCWPRYGPPVLAPTQRLSAAAAPPGLQTAAASAAPRSWCHPTGFPGWAGRRGGGLAPLGRA